MRRKTALSLSALVAMAAVLPLAGSARASTPQKLFLHAATPVANVDATAETAAVAPGPYMSADPPTSAVAKAAVAAVGGNVSLRKNFPIPYWGGPAHGLLTGTATAEVWVSSQRGETLLVRLYGDGGTPVASKSVAVPSGPPSKVDVTFDGLNAPIDKEIVLEVVARSQADADALAPACVNGHQNIECGNGDTVVLFDSIDDPSSLTFTLEPLSSGGSTPPEFANYPAPEDNTQGLESSIGVDRRNGTVMGLDALTTLSVTFDDSKSPPKPTWRNVSALQTSVVTSDAIMWVDSATGRAFVSQLTGPTSIFAFTDDDGATWTSAQPPSSAPAYDHQTVGGGPWADPKPLTAVTAYPHAVYYCAQGNVEASCARSDTGGLTWGPPIPFNTGQCTGLHGHVAVGPDGAVYVPQRNCGGQQATWVSKDNGVTWTLHKVTGTHSGNSDPKIAFDKDGTLYFVASSVVAGGGKIPVVATSTNDGTDWSLPVDIGTSAGIKNAEQPAIVAGDAGKIAAFFYGTTTDGTDQVATFAGTWQPYVSFSYDGGVTWTAVDLSPGDPAQRGWICLAGLSCTSGRNLLEFQDITIDANGRVLVSYADGCTEVGMCNTPTGTATTSRDSHFTIARQTTGHPLLIGP